MSVKAEQHRPGSAPREQLRPREPFLAGPSTFASFVSYETVINAGFNYWETSGGIVTDHGTVANYYHSQVRVGKEMVNIVVARDIRRSNGRSRADWYFGTFSGRHSGECETDEDLDEYNKRLKSIVTRPNRVAGFQLEGLIRQAAGI